MYHKIGRMKKGTSFYFFPKLSSFVSRIAPLGIRVNSLFLNILLRLFLNFLLHGMEVRTHEKSIPLFWKMEEEQCEMGGEKLKGVIYKQFQFDCL